ncbi:CoA-transferase family III [Suillus bovinus]|uniref:CoA-transferase family III n=1 Tax=Suillus bovinus TaxID=48563 RepID=UPI001B8752C6|nr:CoA-transferase family III [Suillus bovinus]KAG2133640.1 CoA-transferase family III [Suillus bovinus]
MSLNGIKVIEFAGLAPGPFAGLVLAHNGASVIRIDRPSSTNGDLLSVGKRSIALDLKTVSGLRVAKDLIAKAECQLFHTSDKREGLNDRLIYARLAGFPRNGHDINYIALSGILSMLPGTIDEPTFPLNLIADFAGGGLLCANGILLAITERVVNVDMVSGSRYISSFPLISAGSGAWAGPRGTNVLDGGAPFYDVYTCSDGKWMSIGCLEPQFFAQFIDKFNEVIKSSGNQGSWLPSRSMQYKKEEWPKLRKYLEDGFRTQPRDFWTDVFHGTDACAVPVLSPAEAAQLHGSLYPMPHPEFSRTSPSSLPQNEIKTLDPGKHTADILRELGLSEKDMRQLVTEGALGKEARELERPKSRL